MKKNTVKNIVYAVIISAVATPGLGGVAHVMEAGAFQHNDAKMSHRFECAYTLNPNPEHKKFTSYQYVAKEVEDAWFDADGNPVNDEGISVPTAQIQQDARYPYYIKFCNEEKYTANPFLTALTYMGVGGLAYYGLRRREKLAANVEQRTR